MTVDYNTKPTMSRLYSLKGEIVLEFVSRKAGFVDVSALKGATGTFGDLIQP
jgi:hypothetical protein